MIMLLGIVIMELIFAFAVRVTHIYLNITPRHNLLALRKLRFVRMATTLPMPMVVVLVIMTAAALPVRVIMAVTVSMTSTLSMAVAVAVTMTVAMSMPMIMPMRATPIRPVLVSVPAMRLEHAVQVVYDAVAVAAAHTEEV